MTEESFRLPQSSYGELVKIIKGYGAHNAEAVPDDISKVTGLHPTIVSRNNAFLVGINIVQGGKKKTITDRGLSLARALEHDMPHEITKHWKEIVLGNDFLNKVLVAVRIRKGMDTGTLLSHIAYSAGQPKSAGIMAGAAAMIDILRAAALLKEEDGKLIAMVEDVTSAITETSSIEEQFTSKTSVQPSQSGVKDSSQNLLLPLSTANIPVTIQLHIQVQCSADDIGNLAPKLRSLIKELTKEEPQATQNGEA
ncbi:MAG: hypothetical protein HOP32_14765 [Nitrospira sp.]|nr:hypothetical protein [Nitrospira sp.]